MVLPEIPLPFVIAILILFIILIIFTNLRYELKPKEYLSHGTTISALAIGFIFLYALQKYDQMDANYPIVVKNIVFLTDIALKYDPSSICYLVQYLDDFLNFDNTGYPIFQFEQSVLEKIEDPDLTYRVHASADTLANTAYQRISGTNLIAAPVWYVVFISATILTIIFPMDINLKSKIDAVLLTFLIWLPVITIYTMYLTSLGYLNNAITNLRDDLKIIMCKKKVNCYNVLTYDANTFSGIIGEDPNIGFQRT